MSGVVRESSRRGYGSAEHRVSPGISMYRRCQVASEAVTPVWQLLLNIHRSCSWGCIYPTHHPCQDTAGVMLGDTCERRRELPHQASAPHPSHTPQDKPCLRRVPSSTLGQAGAWLPTLPVLPSQPRDPAHPPAGVRLGWGDPHLREPQGANQPLPRGCRVLCCEQTFVQPLVRPAPRATRGRRSTPAEPCLALDTFPHALQNHSRCPKRAMERSRGQAIKPPICLNP